MSVHVSSFVVSQQIKNCRLASDSNISGVYYNGTSLNGIGATLTTASSTLTVDSVAVVNGDSVLLTAQTSGFQNGIYLVSGVGVAVVLTRRNDFQCPMQMIPGYYLSISEGTVYGGKIFSVIAPQATSVGVSTVSFQGPDIVSAPTTLNLENAGLNVYNPAGTFLNHIVPTSAITAARQFSLITGNQATTLNLSSAINFAPTAFGGTLSAEATALTAVAYIGVKYGSSGPLNIVSPSANSFTAANILSTDVVVVNLVSCTTAAYITTVVPLNGSINIGFNTAPGANTIINYYGHPTI